MSKTHQIDFCKIPTGIEGLDELFYNGLDLSGNHTLILIRGGEDTERLLLGLQMIYGIAQGYYRLNEYKEIEEISPYVYSSIHTADYIEDLMMDVVLSKSIAKYLSYAISHPSTEPFVSAFFDIKEVGSVKKRNIEEGDLDKMLSDEALYYSNRTNSLHFRTPDSSATIDNLLFPRIWNSMEKINPELNKTWGKNDKLDYPYIKMVVNRSSNWLSAISDNNKNDIVFSSVKLLIVDIPNIDDIKFNKSFWVNFISTRDKNSGNQKDPRTGNDIPEHKVTIVTLPRKVNDTQFPDYSADIIIDLKSTIELGYYLTKLSVTKSKLQISALGWHQYKRRDQGIEVYPSVHKLFQSRRYLQRALVHTHSNVVTDTYQQYLSKNYSGSENYYAEYKNQRDKISANYIDNLNTANQFDYKPGELLERILLGANRKHPGQATENNLIHTVPKGITAFVGASNTYKRYLVYGCSFAYSITNQHTLLLLLNKDENTIRRRLSCPAINDRRKACKACNECYKRLHFMNIMMGCITPEEFIYYLKEQLDTPFIDGNRINRIILDDLQIIDHCFPLLHSNLDLFLAALIGVCRERDIALELLCDNDCDSATVSRVLSDNVVITERDDKGHLKIIIERYAGYNIIPSKMYGALIQDVKKLFQCGTKKWFNKDWKFDLDSRQLCPFKVNQSKPYSRRK